MIINANGLEIECKEDRPESERVIAQALVNYFMEVADEVPGAPRGTYRIWGLDTFCAAAGVPIQDHHLAVDALLNFAVLPWEARSCNRKGGGLWSASVNIWSHIEPHREDYDTRPLVSHVVDVKLAEVLTAAKKTGVE